jgi:hypothetical protein
MYLLLTSSPLLQQQSWECQPEYAAKRGGTTHCPTAPKAQEAFHKEAQADFGDALTMTAWPLSSSKWLLPSEQTTQQARSMVACLAPS